MKKRLKLGLDGILELIKSGLSPAKIEKEHGFSKQSISYYVGKLKKLGCIQKEGYGTWRYIKGLKEVKIRPQDTRGSQRQIRGHAFIWKIQFYDIFEWEKVVRGYQKKKLTFQRISQGKVFRIILNGRKIWLTKKGMVIYEPLDFYGKSSFETKGTAVFEMDKLIKEVLKELNQKFRFYKFTTSREHYGIIKNELARQYNDKKEKMFIKSEDGDVWMWIDNSKSLSELENNEPIVNKQVQSFWNNHKKHKFKIDADFVLDTFNKISDIQKFEATKWNFYSKNIETHTKAIQKLEKGINQLVGIKKSKSKRKLKGINQRSLKEYI